MNEATEKPNTKKKRRSRRRAVNNDKAATPDLPPEAEKSGSEDADVSPSVNSPEAHTSEDISGLNLWQRIVRVRAELGYIQKDKEIGKGNYAYHVVTNEAINRALLPLLNKYLLVDDITLLESTVWDTCSVMGSQDRPRKLMQYQGRFRYRIRCADQPEQFHAIDAEGFGDDGGDKGPGKGQTYAFKAARAKLFSIDVGDNEESRDVDEQIVSPQEKPLTPLHLDDILHRADEYFGDDAEAKLESLCTKIFHLPELRMIPDAYYDQAMERLKRQAIREGRIEDDNAPSDDIPMGD